MSGEIDPKEFGALQADVKTLTAEIHLLRKEMVGINAAINQGKGGIYVLLLAAGSVGALITMGIKKLFS
ncbi:hypothetical protein [Polynucleobacter paneuropaeus]|jgi:hypothetical protein|uniref:Uncharacterized protein n=1 Tax=uncultured Caudovirales phage TaxID=2100421 RepID=A0A6J5KL73_9CAUD|nr:hypothetical protein [Polynucleobacter paneuropaeus]MBT8527538.1 hypothetical protein [Polynucleobacter paneuropaeus]QWD55252.1 hypothetical protein C2750_05810 [Polynucleobacter paneuropaeus]CAB4121090.1 hypothetical protein UFOVP7_36 [uncultured Caudovirales phage]